MMGDFLWELGGNLWAAVLTLLLFGLTIFIHELGHFLVARWCGLQVDAFSIGFGPAIWQRTVKGVVYKIGIFPLGGYVALPQLDPTGGNPHKPVPGAPAAPPRQLPRIGPIRKILVSLAGVTGNIILAYLLAWVVYLGGGSFSPEKTNLVGYVDTNSTAYADGFRLGDEITAVGRRSVRTWEDFIVGVALSPPEDHVIHVRRSDGTPAEITPRTDELMGARYVAGLDSVSLCYILKVDADSSAAKAGIKPGDQIVSLGGERLLSRQHLSLLVQAHVDQPMAVTINRKGHLIESTVTPRLDRDVKPIRPRIGVEFNNIDVKPPVEQLRSHAMPIFAILHALTQPKQAKIAAGQVGGPVKIFQIFWLSAKVSIILALWFTVMLNVNLAIMNLLPLPVLDGGHIVLSLWELLTRRPVGARVVNVLWNVFAALLVALFLLITFRDVRGLFGKGDRTATNAPPGAATNMPPAAATNAQPAAAR